MTEKYRYLNSTEGCAMQEYHRIWVKVCTLNSSHQSKAREVCLCEEQRSAEVCTPRESMDAARNYASIGYAFPPTCSKHDKVAKRGPKSCQCVCLVDRGWPKSREGYGHGAPIVVKPVNGRIMAKGGRLFYPNERGGTADA